MFDSTLSDDPTQRDDRSWFSFDKSRSRDSFWHRRQRPAKGLRSVPATKHKAKTHVKKHVKIWVPEDYQRHKGSTSCDAKAWGGHGLNCWQTRLTLCNCVKQNPSLGVCLPSPASSGLSRGSFHRNTRDSNNPTAFDCRFHAEIGNLPKLHRIKPSFFNTITTCMRPLGFLTAARKKKLLFP